jgi:hypothetical protein
MTTNISILILFIIVFSCAIIIVLSWGCFIYCFGDTKSLPNTQDQEVPDQNNISQNIRVINPYYTPQIYLVQNNVEEYDIETFYPNHIQSEPETSEEVSVVDTIYNDGTCVICFDEIDVNTLKNIKIIVENKEKDAKIVNNKNSDIVATRCGHIFCRKCLAECKNMTCPSCNTELKGIPKEIKDSIKINAAYSKK